MLASTTEYLRINCLDGYYGISYPVTSELQSMILASNEHSTIVNTERGLTIAGTRITLYDVMDYVVAQYPPIFIRSLFGLTEAQLDAALSYIDRNRAEVEAEYQLVLKQAEENRQYWGQRNREHLARIATMSPKPGQEALWEKLQAQKARHKQEARSFFLDQ